MLANGGGPGGEDRRLKHAFPGGIGVKHFGERPRTRDAVRLCGVLHRPRRRVRCLKTMVLFILFFYAVVAFVTWLRPGEK